MSNVKEFTDVEIDGVCIDDYPDFCDAYAISATAVLEDGSMRDATEEELEELTNDGTVNELAHQKLF
jgi:hypothetical protein